MSKNTQLLTRWQQICAQLQANATLCGRDPRNVHLLAVSKQHPPEAIRALAQAGQRDFGENYVQEAVEKQQHLTDLNLTWHYIGQIQSNKTRLIAEHFHWAHTVDQIKYANRLNEQRPAHLPPLQVCIQVKLAAEVGKGGLWPEQVAELALSIQQCSRLTLRGLMCIPQPLSDPHAQLAQFQKMTALMQKLNAQGMSLDTLSMGMSDDYPAAIAAGATLIRIGTAIFGTRKRINEEQ